MIEAAIKQYLAKHRLNKIELHTAMFDMDGVLFDSMKNHAQSWHLTMQRFGLNLPYEEAFLHEGRTGAGTINIVSMRERGREATEEEIKSIYACKSRLFNTYPIPQPMPGAYQLLKKVKQSGIIPMVVTGSGQKSLIERLQNNFPGIFSQELMVTALDVKNGKPDPEPYLMGLQKSDSTPANAIVIENAPLGVQAATAAGVFTIAVNTGPLPDSILLQAGANLLFPSMQVLADNWETLLQAFSHVSI